jgi:chromosome segregation ATPase
MGTELLVFTYVAITSAVSALAASYFTYLGTKKKSVASYFDSIIKANEIFRKDVKTEMDSAKEDSIKLRKDLIEVEDKYKISIEQITDLQKIIIDYQSEITELKKAIDAYQSEIAILRSVIDDYKSEVEQLRKEIQRLNNS